MPRRDSPGGGGHWFGGLIAIGAGLLAIVYCGQTALLALSSGVNYGWRGVHYAGEWHYYTNVAANFLGIVFGLVLIRMGWRWLRD